MGKIIAVCMSPEKGTAKQNVHQARVVENHGLEGDAHAGTWHRQVSLLSYESIEQFKAEGAQVTEGAFGENLVIEGFESEGYTFRISPMVAYAFRNNMALGARFAYGRTLLKLDKANLSLGDEDSGINLQAKDFYSLKHSYPISAIWRQYIPLGRSKRFALFNETSLSFGGIQSKFANDSPVKGTYQTGYEVGIGISPGIVAFATNNMAVEVNVGVMGINYSHIKQVHNQVRDGDIKSSMMNFKVNIFSIGLGMAFYL